MAGVMLGQAVRKKYFPEEGRVASLAFIYSPDEVDQIRGRRLPAPALSRLEAKRKRRRATELKAMLFIFPPTIALFAIIALAGGAPTTGARWAIFLIGVGACVFIFLANRLSQWVKHDRHVHPSALQIFTAPAIFSKYDQTVRFGKAENAPHWIFPFDQAKTLIEGAEYTVFHVHDVLIYLEPAT